MSNLNFPPGNSSLLAALYKLTGNTQGNINPETLVIKGDHYNENNSLLYLTNELGAANTANFFGQMDCPGFYYFSGTYNRIYFRFLEGIKNLSGATRAGRSTKNWISYLDLNSRRFGPRYELPTTYPNSTDLHNMAALLVADNGRIVTVVEELNGPLGSHNSPLNVYVSDNPEDTSAFTRVVQLTGVEATYPMLKKLANGEIYLFARNRVAGDEMYLVCYKSTDNGLTWKSLTGVANTPTTIINLGASGRFLYKFNITQHKDSGIHIGIHDHQGVGSFGRANYWLHTNDGVTWNNAREFMQPGTGYKRNILIAGVLSKALLDTNYLVHQVADSLNPAVLYRHGSISPVDNECYQIFGVYDSSTANQDKCINLYLARYDYATDTWIKTDILPLLSLDSTYPNQFNLSGTCFIHSWGNGLIDLIIANVDHENGFINPTPVLTSGVLVPGMYYRVVASATVNYFGTGVVAGDIIRGNGTLTANATNTVRAIKMIAEVYRSFDKGLTWVQVTKLDKYNYNGMPGAMGITDNAHEVPDNTYIAVSAQKSKAGNLIEYADLIFTKIL